MSVVLRCPTCGTTRPTPGQCEACHEAEARYFCTNHTPGVWVDAPTCPKCGGRFGEVRRPPTPVPGPPVRTRPLEPARTPPTLSPPRAPYSPAEPPGAGDEWEVREGFPPDRGAGLPTGASPLWMLLNVLNAAGRARRTPPVMARERGRPGMGRGIFGCLVQLLVLFVSIVMGGLFLFQW